MERVRQLRDRIARDGDILLLPGAPNALSARILQDVGFEAVYATGAGIANSAFGFPDVGLVTMSETVSEAARIVRAVDLPVVADADTGYGGPLNVMRTVQELERVGVAAIQLEDQVSPKRCGHFAGKSVVDPEEMCTRIGAAIEARRNPDLVIIARTDAAAEDGIDAAIARANQYLAAGADVAFVEAPRSEDELSRIPREVRGPVLANMVEGGLTPVHSASELQAMGYRIGLFANTALRLAMRAVAEGMHRLRTTGTSDGLLDRLLTWERRQQLVGLERFQALEDQLVQAGTSAASRRP